MAALPLGPSTTAGVSRPGSIKAGANAAAKDRLPHPVGFSEQHGRLPDDVPRERSRIVCAAAASARRTGQSGMLLSHSISVGIGPQRRDHDLEQLPDGVGDRPIVAVDQQPLAFIVGLFGMTGQMNLADTLRAENRTDSRAPKSRGWSPRRRRC